MKVEKMIFKQISKFPNIVPGTLKVIFFLAILIAASQLTAQVTGTPKSSNILNSIELFTKIVAFAAAAAFFLYKLISGFFLIDMSISIATERIAKDESDIDHLGITVTLSKGDRSSVIIEETHIRIICEGTTIDRMELNGLNRLDASLLKNGEWVRDKKRPKLYLSPGEEASFSCVAKVAYGLPCIIEVAIPGRRLNISRLAQWRASSVSLPVKKGAS